VPHTRYAVIIINIFCTRKQMGTKYANTTECKFKLSLSKDIRMAIMKILVKSQPITGTGWGLQLETSFRTLDHPRLDGG
jgi:hypothetical protein